MAIEYIKLLEQVGESILAPMAMGAGYYIVKVVGSVFASKKKRHLSLNVSAYQTDKLLEKLIELRVSLKADRTYACKFHNGDKYISGSEILKYTRLSETVAPGVSMEIGLYQDLNITLVSDEIKAITEASADFISVKELQDSYWRRILMAQGVIHTIRFPVKSGNNIIGFIGIDYCDVTEKPANIDEIPAYAGQIGQILESYK